MADARDGTGAGSAVKPPLATDVDVRSVGATAVVTFNRCSARNAITDSIRGQLAAAYPRFARDAQVYAVVLKSACPGVFSAGGDVREMAALARSDAAAARALMAREYALNWLHECFSKPTVSLIDGVVMGTGVGVTLYGTHRVAGEGYRFAMPETQLGFFPDDGVALAFARMPHEMGVFLALTGRAIGRADAFRLGLVTHCIGAMQFSGIETKLANAETVDPLLDGWHEEPGAGEIENRSELIAEWFSGNNVATIVRRIEKASVRSGAHSEFAAGVLADLNRASPLSLAVTLRHIREARDLDLRLVLVRDYRLASRFLDDSDFREGVRALLVDKDRKPRWRPSSLAALAAHAVDCYFAPMPGAELNLPTRQEMQAARV